MTQSPLLLAMLSVLALWAFLTELVVGLLLVFKALDAIRGALGRIAMGVRAIAQQTAPVDRLADEVSGALDEIATPLRALGERAAEQSRA